MEGRVQRQLVLGDLDRRDLHVVASSALPEHAARDREQILVRRRAPVRGAHRRVVGRAHLTAATGIDALVHAVEAATNRNASPANSVAAHEAIRLVATHL
ncbi:MAG: iron-containing alcohol dehydrogenase, partial [Alphaproteobacteria bacterium]